MSRRLKHLQGAFQRRTVCRDGGCSLRVGGVASERRVVVHTVTQKQYGAGNLLVTNLREDERVPAVLYACHGLLGKLVIALRQATEGNQGAVLVRSVRCGLLR